MDVIGLFIAAWGSEEEALAKLVEWAALHQLNYVKFYKLLSNPAIAESLSTGALPSVEPIKAKVSPRSELLVGSPLQASLASSSTGLPGISPLNTGFSAAVSRLAACKAGGSRLLVASPTLASGSPAAAFRLPAAAAGPAASSPGPSVAYLQQCQVQNMSNEELSAVLSKTAQSAFHIFFQKWKATHSGSWAKVGDPLVVADWNHCKATPALHQRYVALAQLESDLRIAAAAEVANRPGLELPVHKRPVAAIAVEPSPPAAPATHSVGGVPLLTADRQAPTPAQPKKRQRKKASTPAPQVQAPPSAGLLRSPVGFVPLHPLGMGPPPQLQGMMPPPQLLGTMPPPQLLGIRVAAEPLSYRDSMMAMQQIMGSPQGQELAFTRSPQIGESPSAYFN